MVIVRHRSSEKSRQHHDIFWEQFGGYQLHQFMNELKQIENRSLTIESKQKKDLE
jgi:hypothetical protein